MYPTRFLIAELKALAGDAKVTFPEADQDYPTVERLLSDIPRGSDLTAFESLSDDDWPGLKLAEQYIIPGDAQYVQLYQRFRKFPGPEIITRTPDKGLIREDIRQVVLGSTQPSAAGDEKVTGSTVVEATLTRTQWRAVGVGGAPGALVGSPIYDEERADPETRCNSTYHTYRKEADGLSPAFPSLNSVYGTAKLLGGSSSAGVNGIAIDAPGSGYTSLPTITSTPPSGATAATFTATSLKAVTVTLVDGAGDGVTAGTQFNATSSTGQVTIPGVTPGLSLVAGTSTITHVAVATDTHGTGFLLHDRITVAGGTPTTVPAATADLWYLLATSKIAGGSGYIAGEVITIDATGLHDDSDVLEIRVVTIGSGGAVKKWAFANSSKDSLYTSKLAGPLKQTATDGSGAGFSISTPVWARRTLITPAHTGRAVLEVTAGTLLAVSIVAPGSGYTRSEAVPASTSEITLAGGTFTAAAKVKPTRLCLINADITAGGTGFVEEDLIELEAIAGTTFARTVVRVDVVSSGVVTEFTIITPGSFSTNDDELAQVATDGSGSGFGISPSSCGIVEAVVTSAGDYTEPGAPFTQGSATGGGTGAAFLGTSFSVWGVAIIDGGLYTAVATDLSIYSTTGAGTGWAVGASHTGGAAPTFSLVSVAILTAGTYGTPQSNPMSFTSGGNTITVNVLYGLGTASVTTAGTKYPLGNRSLTITGGGGTGAKAHSISEPQDWREVDAYIVDAYMEDKPGSALKALVWVTMPIPAERADWEQLAYSFPDILDILTDQSDFSRPQPGLDFNLRPARSAVYPAHRQWLYFFGPPPQTQVPAVFDMISPAAGSSFFPVSKRTAHAAFTWMAFTDNGDGTITIARFEKFEASTIYVPGQTLIARVAMGIIRGNIWFLAISRVNESGPLFALP